MTHLAASRATWSARRLPARPTLARKEVPGRGAGPTRRPCHRPAAASRSSTGAATVYGVPRGTRWIPDVWGGVASVAPARRRHVLRGAARSGNQVRRCGSVPHPANATSLPVVGPSSTHFRAARSSWVGSGAHEKGRWPRSRPPALPGCGVGARWCGDVGMGGNEGAKRPSEGTRPRGDGGQRGREAPERGDPSRKMCQPKATVSRRSLRTIRPRPIRTRPMAKAKAEKA